MMDVCPAAAAGLPDVPAQLYLKQQLQPSNQQRCDAPAHVLVALQASNRQFKRVLQHEFVLCHFHTSNVSFYQQPHVYWLYLLAPMDNMLTVACSCLRL
jgi:hypothetical protein